MLKGGIQITSRRGPLTITAPTQEGGICAPETKEELKVTKVADNITPQCG